MKNDDIKTNVDVNGAILTAKCIETLKQIQCSDNEEINYWTETIASAICTMAAHMNYVNEPYKAELMATMGSLGNLNSILKSFKKP
jgi:hypothetical protein